MVADECGNVLYSHSEILPFAQDINNSPKSLEINGNVTCVSGSPKRTLNSTTKGAPF